MFSKIRVEKTEKSIINSISSAKREIAEKKQQVLNTMVMLENAKKSNDENKIIIANNVLNHKKALYNKAFDKFESLELELKNFKN